MILAHFLKTTLKSVLTISALAVVMNAVFLVDPAFAQAGVIDRVISNIQNSVGTAPFLFSVFCYIFGGLFLITGLFKLRLHVDNPSGEPLKGGLARLLGGGALLAAPTIVAAIQDILAEGGTGVPNTLPDGGTPAGLGGMINNLTRAVQTPEAFFALIAYLFGIGFAIWAIVEFIKAGENSNQTPLRRPLLIAITASALLALPDILSALKATFFFQGVNAIGYGNIPLNASCGGGALDQIFTCVIKNIYDPFLILFQHISWIAGVALALVAVFRLMKGAQDGPRSSFGMGTLGTFAAAAALTSVPTFMGAAQESIFGSNNVLTYAVLAGSGDPNVISRANQAILAVFLFVRIVGWFSFVRGIFILRAYAEGTGQASMAAGFTHIIGGAVAVNLAALVKAVQQTLGLTGLVIS